jgi:hypothetical protein
MLSSPAAFAQPSPPLLCVVEQKLDASHAYSSAELEKFKFHVEVLVEEETATTRLRRCSFVPSHGRVTCDDYIADRVTTDPVAGIRKYYYFRGQFDVQVFRDGSFIENNGRGSIGFGRCAAK